MFYLLLFQRRFINYELIIKTQKKGGKIKVYFVLDLEKRRADSGCMLVYQLFNFFFLTEYLLKKKIIFQSVIIFYYCPSVDRY